MKEVHYKYFTDHAGKVIAVSTYAGRTVRGVAICDPRDKFDIEFGKKLAAARCNHKVATKRSARAWKKFTEAKEQLKRAQAYYDKMSAYVDDSDEAVLAAIRELNHLQDQA